MGGSLAGIRSVLEYAREMERRQKGLTKIGYSTVIINQSVCFRGLAGRSASPTSPICYQMDAIGALSAFGTLSSLIPNLKFVGVYSITKNTSITVPTWKFGIASCYGDNFEYHNSGGGVEASLTLSGLIAPNIRMRIPNGTFGCEAERLTGSNKTYATAILFNY